MIPRTAGLAFAAALASGAPAHAQVDLFSREVFSGLADVRLVAADGEKSWTDTGYGKARYGGDADGDLKVGAHLAEAALIWKPRFTWALSGVLHVQHQPEQEHDIDVVEAFLNWKPTPSSAWRYGARAGLFYPPISMEHEDPAWGVTHTITPSAINSWVGEEVKVLGLEGKVGHVFESGDEVSLTGALFDYNDTSGTLLSLRGWALHDIQSTAFGGQTLPGLLPRYRNIWRGQALDDTYPVYVLDKRVGAYGRLDWRTRWRLTFNLFYYDNFGNRTGVRNGQWSWDTRFWNFGATYDVDKKTRVMGQLMTGSTLEGFLTPRGLWIDVDFNSAYLLATHSFGKSSVTGRVEYFNTRDYTFQDRDDNNEHGWAMTAAYRYEVTPYATLRLEALHVESDRPARVYQAVQPRQDQTVVQSSLRFHF